MRLYPKRIDLSDVTALITVRIDSPERKANLTALLKVLLRDYDIHIYVLEADARQRFYPGKKFSKVTYRFIKDADPVFHRTRYFKIMQDEVQTPFFAIWDVDVIGIPVQILEAVSSLREGKAFLSLPYDGRVCSFDRVTSYLFRKTLDHEVLLNFAGQMPLIFGNHSVGGICFLNREKYLETGGENTNFYGWGPEDIERVKRFEVFGYPIYQTNGYLFHLYHPARQNSWYADRAAERQNRMELLSICSREK